MNRLLTILFVSTLAFGGAVQTSASSLIELIEVSDSEISVSVRGNVLHVSGAEGQMLYIYNVAGVRVKSIRIDGDDKQYSVNLPKGCYIVKVGDMVRKIAIN